MKPGARKWPGSRALLCSCCGMLTDMFCAPPGPIDRTSHPPDRPGQRRSAPCMPGEGDQCPLTHKLQATQPISDDDCREYLDYLDALTAGEVRGGQE